MDKKLPKKNLKLNSLTISRISQNELMGGKALLPKQKKQNRLEKRFKQAMAVSDGWPASYCGCIPLTQCGNDPGCLA